MPRDVTEIHRADTLNVAISDAAARGVRSEGREGDPTVPANHSIACRSCRAPIAYDEPDEGGAVRCPACGAANVAPVKEEETDGTA